MRLLGADGDLQRPDRVRAIFQIEVTGRAISLQLVSIGEEAWMTNLLTGDWAIAPPEFGYRPTILFSPVYGIGQMMATAQHIERLQDETISGRSAYHLRAATVRAFVRPLTYNTIKGSPVTVEFWIDRETLDLLRTRISEPRGANRTDPAVWTIDFSHHNDAVSIEPPV
jgi:hypothetical protein